MEAIHEVVPLRQCTKKISARSIPKDTSCALLDMGKCGAPCIGLEDVDSYSRHAIHARELLHFNSSQIESHLARRMHDLSQTERFEEAGEFRNRLSSFTKGASRAQRIRSLAGVSHLIAATPLTESGWEFICIRYGRLAGSACAPNNATIAEILTSLTLTAEVVMPSEAVLPASSYEEIEKLLNYLETPGVRLVELEGEWSLPIFGSGSMHTQFREQRSAWEGAIPLD